MRVLIVEDDRKTADYLAKGLHENGFVVDSADNGVDGLHLASEMGSIKLTAAHLTALAAGQQPFRQPGHCQIPGHCKVNHGPAWRHRHCGK